MIGHAGCGRKEMRCSCMFLFMGWREGNGGAQAGHHIYCASNEQEYVNTSDIGGTMDNYWLSIWTVIWQWITTCWRDEVVKHFGMIDLWAGVIPARTWKRERNNLTRGVLGQIHVVPYDYYRVTRKSNRWQTRPTGDVWCRLRGSWRRSRWGRMYKISYVDSIMDGPINTNVRAVSAWALAGAWRLEEASRVGGNSHV